MGIPCTRLEHHQALTQFFNRITKVHEDKSKLTTHLTSQIAKWQDVTGPFELDFGKVLQHPRPPGRMSKRFDFLESAENLFGKYPYGESVAFDVALGDEKEPENVFRLE